MPHDPLRFPVGPFAAPDVIDDASLSGFIDELAALPQQVTDAVGGLDDARLDTPYRPGGWTRRQVVHHLADSHMNAYVRVRLALTEDTPRIRPYDEAAWAELPDAREAPVDVSLALLAALHARWVRLLRATDPAVLRARAYDHPELGRVPLDRAVAMYAWHSRHHLAHLTGALARPG